MDYYLYPSPLEGSLEEYVKSFLDYVPVKKPLGMILPFKSESGECGVVVIETDSEISRIPPNPYYQFGLTVARSDKVVLPVFVCRLPEIKVVYEIYLNYFYMFANKSFIDHCAENDNISLVFFNLKGEQKRGIHCKHGLQKDFLAVKEEILGYPIWSDSDFLKVKMAFQKQVSLNDICKNLFGVEFKDKENKPYKEYNPLNNKFYKNEIKKEIRKKRKLERERKRRNRRNR